MGTADEWPLSMQVHSCSWVYEQLVKENLFADLLGVSAKRLLPKRGALKGIAVRL
jgi:hypothetical protein